MADIADRADAVTELNLKIALDKRHKEARLRPVGSCYNCSEAIENGLFCDADCRDDYEKRERMR